MTEQEERLLYLLQSAVASLIIKVTSQTGDADVSIWTWGRMA